MKTAISLPDAVFREAERYARRTGKSRSHVYSQALAEYLTRHSPERIVESLDRVCEKVGQPDAFVASAARRVLERTEW